MLRISNASRVIVFFGGNAIVDWLMAFIELTQSKVQLMEIEKKKNSLENEFPMCCQ